MPKKTKEKINIINKERLEEEFKSLHLYMKKRKLTIAEENLILQTLINANNSYTITSINPLSQLIGDLMEVTNINIKGGKKNER